MSYPYGPFTVAVGTVAIDKTVQWPQAANAVFLNESPYTLHIDPGTGSVYVISAFTQDLIPLGNQYSGVFKITASADLTITGSTPASVLYIQVYAQGEPVAGAYPMSLSRLTNVGNTTLTASQVINNGNPIVTQVVEATPQGAVSSQLLWNNDGSGLFGGGIIGVDSSGGETWTNPNNGTIVLFVWDNTGFAGGHKLLLQLTASNELELFDFTASVVLAQFSATGGLVLPFVSILANGSILQTGGDVSFDNGSIASNGSGLLTIAELSSDGATITTDGTGKATFSKNLSGATQNYIKVLPGDGAGAEWDIALTSAGDLQFIDDSGNPKMTLRRATNGFGVQLTNIGGYLEAWSRFTGTGNGTFSHGLGTTPNLFSFTDTSGGSQTFGVGTVGSTTVVVQTGAGHAWEAWAARML